MKAIDIICRVTGMAAMGVLFLMTLLTVADVFLRFAFNKPIIGTTEMTEQMLVAVAFLGFGWCAQQERHINVDLLVSHYKPGTQRVVALLTNSVGMAFVAVLCWQTFVAALKARELGLSNAYIGVPVYPFYMVASFGLAVLLLAIAGLLVKNMKEEPEI